MKRPPACAFVVAAAMCAATVLSISSTATAQSSRAAESRITQSALRPSIETRLEEQLAHDWGLQPEEWLRFRTLMRGPLGIYSPNLDPLTALGIEARSDEERRHFAELQVRAEGHRTEKMLAYQRAYDEAWKRMQPALHPVKSTAPALTNQSHTGAATEDTGRLAVFVKDNCAPCDQRVKELQATGRAFDLYMVGSRQDDSRIREWAVHAGIDPAKVRARTITLNHDAGRWLSIGGQGVLPAVLREVDGQWRRQ